MLDFSHLPGYGLLAFGSACPRHSCSDLSPVVRLQRKKPEEGGRSTSPSPLSWWPPLLCVRSALFLHILTRAGILSERAIAVRDEVFAGKDFLPKSAHLKWFWCLLVGIDSFYSVVQSTRVNLFMPLGVPGENLSAHTIPRGKPTPANTSLQFK